MEPKIYIKTFNELSINELYALMHLRQEVFVVEQDAAYLDADYKDQQSFHVLIYQENILAAYARVIPPSIAYNEASIGRVVTSPKYRRRALGKLLMKVALEVLEEKLDTKMCRISAQTYLIPFYSNFGFKVCSEEYFEDGLPHHEMFKMK